MGKIKKLIFYINLLVIEYLALVPEVNIELIENIWDKFNHFFAFFVLYVLISFAYTKLNMSSKISILLAFAMQIEIFQYFIPQRCFSMLDVLADSVGILLGILFIKVFASTRYGKILES